MHTKIFVIALFMKILVFSMGASEVIVSKENTKCVVNINGNVTLKSIGDMWDSSENQCIKHICEVGTFGNAVETLFREYCDHNCEKGLWVPKEGQCCGECIRKHCVFQNQTYSPGDVWRSEDNCLFYECAETFEGDIVGTKVSSYKKACPKLENCPTNQVFSKGCCAFCKSNSSTENEETDDSFANHDETMSKDTYLNHPCRRECIQNTTPRTCSYKFVLEWYETLSKACYDCPSNETDCFRPHCIFVDGFRRSVLVVNRMMPGPMIDICKGDTIVVDVENHLMGESTTIHWHGLQQYETPFFDGVPHVTQCPILPHTTFRYMFKADIAGTHWWHSHVGMQRSDGAFGAFIIREPASDIPSQIRQVINDQDTTGFIMMMQDWEHKIGVAGFSSFHHSIGDNKPKQILVNGKGRYSKKLKIMETTGTVELDKSIFPKITTENQFNPIHTTNESDTQDDTVPTPYEVFNVDKGLSYRFRTINSGFLNCPLEISIDNHTILVIASDGHYIEPVEVDSLVSYAGERFDFIVNTNQPIGNYWVRIKGLMDCDERFMKAYQGAILRYTGADIMIPQEKLTYDHKRIGFQMNSLNRGPNQVDSVAIVEATALEPDTPELLTEHTDYKFYVHYDFYDKNFPQFNHPSLYSIQSVPNRNNKFFGPQLNEISFRMPSTPLLMGRDESKFCNRSSLLERNIDCETNFCECTHVLQVHLNSTVEVIIVDEGYMYDANHPFHLHGHHFRVVGMERVKPTGITIDEIRKLDESNKMKRRLSGAPIKDTVTVPDGGYTIIRFLANNPGFWLFHCHIDFHVEVGMALIFKVGDYNQMRPLPQNFPYCSNFFPTNTTITSKAHVTNYSLCIIAISFIVAIFN
ncbi:uncharacterized protein LOC129568512 isoform X2 [Sitodiplosis mosellana]|uniref:uncharacterized protein LOC129568512 isoform X2 n=1 Tax=Sitodiplosis mosellana TaxID=263140 RepID=UPI002444A00E|nr:uncharacterized protein LOC129568512 isoform X2 [Sitodiplosis mosellana]